MTKKDYILGWSKITIMHLVTLTLVDLSKYIHVFLCLAARTVLALKEAQHDTM